MVEQHERLDDQLARLAASLDSGDHIVACLQLAEVALALDLRMRREERVFALAYEHLMPVPANPLPKIRDEHESLRRLVSRIASAVDRADDDNALQTIATLRSVLLLHVAKEERLLSAAGAVP